MADSNNKRELLQSLGTISALVISVLALVVSIFETNILKDQQKATVWPYVTIGQNYSGQGFELRANNKGVGPAIIKSVQVEYKGKPMDTYLQILEEAFPNNGLDYGNTRQSNINNMVMQSKEKVVMLAFPWNDTTYQITPELEKNLVIKLQYCSVLGECWYYEYPSDKRYSGEFEAEFEFGN
jgi:hypothetical protein